MEPLKKGEMPYMRFFIAPFFRDAERVWDDALKEEFKAVQVIESRG
ncbi:MAG: hypothetical protein PHS02_02030 [Candidatus ainarchaeum sp.]|nr:hypothetical protein [Candidatus ainarchaeum sp.]